MTTSISRGIVRTSGTCGGRARIDGTRLPVWLLVLRERLGSSETEILRSYPSVMAADLDAAWEYYRKNTLEIDRDIWWQDTAANVNDGATVPNSVIVEGLLLGLDEATVRAAFVPSLTDAQIAAAWLEYRRTPQSPRSVRADRLSAVG